MSEPTPPSKALIVYTPPPTSREFLKVEVEKQVARIFRKSMEAERADLVLTRSEHHVASVLKLIVERYEQNLDFTDILKTHLKMNPELPAAIFDFARKCEREGNKALADTIIKQTINVVRTSPPDAKNLIFLTPPLTGKYPVGVRSYYLEDTSRNERDLLHQTDRTRRLLIDVHYPATQTRPPSYRCQRVIGLDECPDPKMKEKAANLWTHSQPDLPPSTAEKFPVVIFSHGSNAEHDDYPQLVEELTSHGFCVITVNHPFSAGSVPYLGHAQDPKIERDTPQAVEQEIATRTQDIEFVIDQIKEGRIEDFQERIGPSLDTDAIGVIGHSMGGATVVQTCRESEAVKAGINIDGRLGDTPDKLKPVQQPLLTIAAGRKFPGFTEEQYQECFDEYDQFYQKTPDLQQTIPSADHLDFTALPFFDYRMGKTQPQDYARALETNHTTNALVVGFLNKTLKEM